MRLQGKTAIVTGAGSGIGRAIALRLAAEGAAVVIGDIADSGAETAAQIAAAGGKAAFARSDLRREADARLLAGRAAELFGGPHIVVNNAGVTCTTNVLTADDAEWDRVMDLNLRGAWYMCKHAIPLMIEAGGGSIVNLSSTHAFRTQFNHFPYHASKGGLESMTRGICVDFGRRGIRANTICPGFIMTPQSRRFLDGFEDPASKERTMKDAHPLGRFGTPEDVADAALFLASDESAFVSGISLVVDGGRSAYQKSD